MGKLLYGIARCKVFGSFIGLAFTFFPFLVSVKKITQNEKAIAFFHPVPSYPEHVLIVPRRLARNIFCLTADYFIEVVQMAIDIRGDVNDFALLINAGKRQDIMQAHFHLFTGNLALQKGLRKENGKTLISGRAFWEKLTLNIQERVIQSHASIDCFSLLIQYEKDSAPTTYFF